MLANAIAAQAAITPIPQSAFAPGATVVTFETGSTMLPTVAGLSFVTTSPADTPWYAGSVNANGFFGGQGWSNLVTADYSTYSDLGAQFDSTVRAVGGYVGSIPNFTNAHPSRVTVELFGSSLNSLGTASITLPASFKSPVYFGFAADEPIAGFRISGNNSGFFGVDNFTFGALVPEPSTAFVLAGISAVLSRQRRFDYITAAQPRPSMVRR